MSFLINSRISWSVILLLAYLGPIAAVCAQQDGRRIRVRIQELDKDGNGKLSRLEFGRDNKAFRAIDTNGDDVIDTAEIMAFLRSGGKIPKPAAPASQTVEIVGKLSEGMAVSLNSCRSAANYSRNATGHALLVSIDGSTVYERYDNGWSGDRPHRLASGTKSFAGVAAALAVEDGLFTFDERVSDTITEWRGDAKLSQVTIRQLLSLTSGIDPGENSVVLPYAKAILIKAKHQPGQKFEYGPNSFQVFGELMRRKLNGNKEKYLDYLQTRLFKPIGMQTAKWRRTIDGDPHVPSGAFVTARQWSKFGEFLRRGGEWGGKQILSRESLAELTRGSEANPGYGMTFWLGRNGGPEDLFMAAGAGKQRLYIVPSLKLVAVRFGETQGRRFQDVVFLDRLIVKPNR